MAVAVTMITPEVLIPNLGRIRKYKIVLSGGATTFDLANATSGSDGSWKGGAGDVHASATAADNVGGRVYWDNTSVKGAAFTANSTFGLMVIGPTG